MKNVIKVYKWILLSVILQMLILLYINNIWLNSNGPVKITTVESLGEDKTPKENDILVKVPDNASRFKTSYDASYLAYTIDGKLEIVAVKEKKDKKVISSEKDILTFYRWLPDRNIIVYAYRAPDIENGRVQIITFDMDTGIEHEYPKIASNLPKKSEVIDLQLSPWTKVLYAVIKMNESQVTVYKYNIMDYLYNFNTYDYGTIFKVMDYQDNLLYQDKQNKIFVRDGAPTKRDIWQLPFTGRLVLLGCSSDDFAFAGELNSENKIDRIHYVKIDTKREVVWSKIDLKKSLTADKIFVTGNRIFGLFDSENSIYDLNTNEVKRYKGKFDEIFRNYVVTHEGNQVRISQLSQ